MMTEIRQGRLRAAALLLLLGGSPAGLGAGDPPPDPMPPPVDLGTEVRDGSRDFDFEHGEWRARISRRVDPLTGSTAWVEYEGISVVHAIWGGAANLGELEVEGPSGRIQGLSLRLYDPASGQWSIRWANRRDGAMGPPMVGGFQGGIGRFYNQEQYQGRAIFVRFVFSAVTPTSFRLEQAFSADGGETWEANWIAMFLRTAAEEEAAEADAKRAREWSS